MWLLLNFQYVCYNLNKHKCFVLAKEQERTYRKRKENGVFWRDKEEARISYQIGQDMERRVKEVTWEEHRTLKTI